MKKPYHTWTAAFILSLLLAASGALLSYGASNGKPDLSGLDGPFVLEMDRRLLVHPDGGLYLLSCSTRESLAAQMTDLENAGRAKWFKAAPFPYRCASFSDRRLFLAGADPQTGCASVFFLDLDTRKTDAYLLPGFTADFTLECKVEEDGLLGMVTVPLGETAGSSTPVTLYRENKEEGILEKVGVRPQEGAPSSSQSVSSEGSAPPVESGDSSLPSSSKLPPSVPSSSSQGQIPPMSQYYRFERGTTVFDLEQQFLAQHRGDCAVRVTSPDGRLVTGGRVGTGCIVEIVTPLGVESRMVAVIPGDLTGNGGGTGSVELLYRCLTGQEELDGAFFESADLTRDGVLTTSDLLELKRLLNKGD